MSVRVNLLPQATKQRDRAAHQRSLVALVGVLFLAGLGGLYLWQSSQLTDAETELAAEQQLSTELRGEEAELAVFGDLANRSEESDLVLSSALADEVSAAGILQDIAMVVPSDTQLESLLITVGPPADPELSDVVGTLTITGKTLTSHAPGVERMLVSLDKIVTFRDLYLNSSTIEDEDAERVATFSLDGQIAPEAQTGRYASGLPEDLR